MAQLEKLPNIGKVLARDLEKVGVRSVDDLRKLGSKKVFLKLREVRQVDDTACINMLYALEGAVQGN